MTTNICLAPHGQPHASMSHTTPPTTPRKGTAGTVKIQRGFLRSPSKTEKVLGPPRKLNPWAGLSSGPPSAAYNHEPAPPSEPYTEPGSVEEPPGPKAASQKVNNMIVSLHISC